MSAFNYHSCEIDKIFNPRDGRMVTINRASRRLFRIVKHARNPEYIRYWVDEVPSRIQMPGELEKLKRFHGGERLSFEGEVEHRATKMARYAYRNSPYYRQLFSEHGISPENFLENLSQLPRLDKTIIRHEGDNLLAMPHSKEDLTFCTTGGSTGEPLSFYMCGGCDQLHQKFLFEMMGYRPGDRILAMDGSIVPPEDRGDGVYWVRKSAHELPYGSFGLSSQYLTPENIGRYYDFIQEFKPHFIRGYPSFIDAVSQFVLANDLRFNFPLKGVELTSESHSDLQLDHISQAFRAPTFDQYGHSEAAIFGYSLGRHTPIYCSPFNGYTEVLDDNGIHVRPGEVGEVVVTGFHNYAMPFLRYRTGDLAQFESREDGVVRLVRVIGRTQDYVYTRQMDKVLLTALIFGRHLRSFSNIRKWQLVQDVPGYVSLHIIPDGEFGVSEEDEIRRAFKDTGMSDVSFEYPQSLPLTARGKSKLLVQNLADPT